MIAFNVFVMMILQMDYIFNPVITLMYLNLCEKNHITFFLLGHKSKFQTYFYDYGIGMCFFESDKSVI